MANNINAAYFSLDADAALNRWMALETWDSGDPEDEARFYQFVRALYVADTQMDDETDLPDFEETLTRAVKDFYPNRLWSSWEKSIERFAANAETIVGYEWANAT